MRSKGLRSLFLFKAFCVARRFPGWHSVGRTLRFKVIGNKPLLCQKDLRLREQDMKSGALTKGGFCKNIPLVILRDLPAKGQSNTRAFIIRFAMEALKDIEDLPRIRLAEADAIIRE